MSIQAVFFDMGGTIDTYYFTRESRINNVHYLRECLLKANIKLDLSDDELADTITRGVATYHKWNRESLIELTPPDVWSQFTLKEIGITRDQVAPIAEELTYLYETKFYERPMRPEIPQVLEKIHSMGLRIGCISNTQSSSQVPEMMKRYGIDHYFDPVILSCDVGIRKPDPYIFYHAASVAHLPTSSIVYVGDKLTRDILGARRAGYRMAIQIKHPYDDGDPDEGPEPDVLIHNMHELIPLLEEEMAKDKADQLKMNGRHLKALFFDAGDILYYRPDRNKNLEKFLAGRELNPSADLEEKRMELKELAYTGQIRRHEYFEQLIGLYGISNPAENAEGVAVLLADDEVVAIFEGVPETINKLKEEGFILGIITDTAMHYSKKLDWFDQHGFGRVWDVVVSSKEEGVRKPARIMYEKALTQTNLLPGEAAFVGHKASELTGAKAVGLHTIAYNYEKGAVADDYIEHFNDLLNLPCIKD